MIEFTVKDEKKVSVGLKRIELRALNRFRVNKGLPPI